MLVGLKRKNRPYGKDTLDRQIGEFLTHKQAYSNANNPAHIQLWIAIADISKEIFEIKILN